MGQEAFVQIESSRKSDFFLSRNTRFPWYVRNVFCDTIQYEYNAFSPQKSPSFVPENSQNNTETLILEVKL